MGQEASKISEKGDLGDPKRLPEASQNTKKTRFDVRSVMEGEKKATPISFTSFWVHFGMHFGVQNPLKIDTKIDDIFDTILSTFLVPKWI